jgi:hypothetical protein
MWLSKPKPYIGCSALEEGGGETTKMIHRDVTLIKY